MAGTDGDESLGWLRLWRTIRSAICVRETFGRVACGLEKYTSTYVFENDFAALKLDTPRFSKR